MKTFSLRYACIGVFDVIELSRTRVSPRSSFISPCQPARHGASTRVTPPARVLRTRLAEVLGTEILQPPIQFLGAVLLDHLALHKDRALDLQRQGDRVAGPGIDGDLRVAAGRVDFGEIGGG